MKIIVLGSNPSNSSPFNDPFTHCRSAKTLDKWLAKLGLSREMVELANVSYEKTPNNRPLKKSEINLEIPRLGYLVGGNIVITLGRTAEEAMQRVVKLNIPRWRPERVIALPHPSGSNRVRNDRELLEKMLSNAATALRDITPNR